MGNNGLFTGTEYFAYSFEGIVAGVQVGYIDGKYVIFPSAEELDRSELDIVVAGTENAVAMVEGEAKEVSEEVMVGALEAAHEAIKSLVAFQKEIISEFEIEKWVAEIPVAPEGFLEPFNAMVDREKLAEIMLTSGKKNKDRALKTYRDELIELFTEKAKETWSEEEIEANTGFVKDLFHDIEKEVMRKRVIEDDVRMDGRKHNEIRPITIELDLLPRAHGSALFTRGETQSLGIVTLGATMDEQIVDTMFEEGSKSFMLHYNFPPFSTGEVKRLRGPGRREIGHGHLAERSLKNIVPKVNLSPTQLGLSLKFLNRMAPLRWPRYVLITGIDGCRSSNGKACCGSGNGYDSGTGENRRSHRYSWK